MPNEITLASLVRQRAEMRAITIRPIPVEVGPKTWAFLLDISHVPIEERVGTKEGYFMGMAVRPADVPEGKLWPVENAA